MAFDWDSFFANAVSGYTQGLQQKRELQLADILQRRNAELKRQDELALLQEKYDRGWMETPQQERDAATEESLQLLSGQLGIQKEYIGPLAIAEAEANKMTAPMRALTELEESKYEDPYKYHLYTPGLPDADRSALLEGDRRRGQLMLPEAYDVGLGKMAFMKPSGETVGGVYDIPQPQQPAGIFTDPNFPGVGFIQDPDGGIKSFAIPKEEPPYDPLGLYSGAGSVAGIQPQNEMQANVLAAAQKHGAPANVVMALVGGESSWNPSASSGKDAHGLFQFIPETAIGVYNMMTGENVPKNAATKAVFRNKMKDPAFATEIGTFYISYLNKKYNGNLDAVFSAYHAGEGRVDNIIKKNGNFNAGMLPRSLGDGNMKTYEYVDMMKRNSAKYGGAAAQTGPLKSYDPTSGAMSFYEQDIEVDQELPAGMKPTKITVKSGNTTYTYDTKKTVSSKEEALTEWGEVQNATYKAAAAGVKDSGVDFESVPEYERAVDKRYAKLIDNAWKTFPHKKWLPKKKNKSPYDAVQNSIDSALNIIRGAATPGENEDFSGFVIE